MKKYSIALLITLVSFSAVADNAMYPGVVDRGVPNIKLPRTKYAPVAPVPSKKKVNDGLKVLTVLKEVRFKDLTLFDEAILQEEIVKPYLGRKFKKEDLVQLKYDLTKFFYDEGYILTGVMSPPQDISDGILEIVVYETKVGKFKLNNDVISKRLEEALRTDVNEGEFFHENTVEQMLSDFNDLQNIKAKLNLKSGKEYATTDLILDIKETDEDIQRITAHNYGSELSGEYVGELHLEKGNLLSLGDKLSFDGSVSDDGMWKVGAGFKTPITLDNLYFDISYYHSENDIGGRLEDLNASGKSDVLKLGLSSKILNRRRHRLSLGGGLELRNHSSYIDGEKETEDKIRQLYLESTYLYVRKSSIWYAGLKLSKGMALLGGSEADDDMLNPDGMLTRDEAEPEAWIFRPTLLTQFPVLNNDLLKISGTGQVSSHMLLSSDMFVLGGYGSVRGFQPAAEAGDSGYQFTVEYTYDLPIHEDWVVSAGPFADGGKVFNRMEDTAVDDELYSAGITIEISSRLFNDNKTMLKFDWATPIGDYDDPDVDDNTFYFRLSQEF